MDKRRFAMFAAMLAVLVGVAVLTQINISPAPAQMAPPKMTGKITDTVVKSFDAIGLPGLHSIQYRRFVMSPGAKIEGDIVFDDHAELCMAQKGAVTATLPDGMKVRHPRGDIFTIPLNAKLKVVAADPKLGFDEFYWSINLKERK